MVNSMVGDIHNSMNKYTRFVQIRESSLARRNRHSIRPRQGVPTGVAC